MRRPGPALPGTADSVRQIIQLMNIHRCIVSLISAFVITLVPQNGTASEAAPSTVMIPAKDNFHLYLLLGQSNMAGRGQLPAVPAAPNPRILVLNKSNEWAVARDPLHFDHETAGVGPGMSFARSMLADEQDASVVIGLIPCAEGGTELKLWEKDGRLFSNAIARATVASEKGTLKGVLWHQGESETYPPKVEADVVSYGVRLARMIRDFRGATQAGEIPFVVGKLSESYDEHPLGKFVNRALENLSNEVERVAFADSKGLAKTWDLIHFTTEDQIEFGKRYAAAMSKLVTPNAEPHR